VVWPDRGPAARTGLGRCKITVAEGQASRGLRDGDATSYYIVRWHAVSAACGRAVVPHSRHAPSFSAPKLSNSTDAGAHWKLRLILTRRGLCPQECGRKRRTDTFCHIAECRLSLFFLFSIALLRNAARSAPSPAVREVQYGSDVVENPASISRFVR